MNMNESSTMIVDSRQQKRQQNLWARVHPSLKPNAHKTRFLQKWRQRTDGSEN